jgi:hypothetical protein
MQFGTSRHFIELLEPFTSKWKQFDGWDFSGLQGEYRSAMSEHRARILTQQARTRPPSRIKSNVEAQNETAIV